MRYTAVGIVMAVMVAVLGLYAAGEDSYYGDGTTRWEHATRSGGTGYLVTMFAMLAASSLAVIVLGVARKGGRWDLVAILAIGLFVPLLLFVYAVLSVGH